MKSIYKILILIVCFTFLFIIALYINHKSKNQISNLIIQINTLNDKLVAIKQEKNELEKLLNEQRKLEDEYSYKWINDEKFNWLNSRDWNKVTLYNPETGDIIDITKNIIFDNIPIVELFGYLKKEENSDYPIGTHSKYVYKFISEKEEHIIEVREPNNPFLIIDGEIFKCSDVAYELAETLLPKVIKLDNYDVLNKMYSSLFIAIKYNYNINNVNIVHDKWRIKALVEFINNEMVVIDNMTEENLSINCSINFYFYGNIITANIYDSNNIKGRYVEIIFDNSKLIFEHIENNNQNIYKVLGIS